MSHPRSAAEIALSWKQDPRWRGIARAYSAEDVVRLRGTLHVEHTIARSGAGRLWTMLRDQAPVRAL